MVRIRMQRLGRRHRPFYRIGATESRHPRSGVFLEQLGWYDPIAKDESKQLSLEPDRIKYWLDLGAQPSDTVRDILGHKDLLPPKMRADWEAKRAIDRRRVECKPAEAKAREFLASFVKMKADIDIAPFKKRVSQAVKAANRASSKADIEAATKAGADAQSAMDDLAKAIEDAKNKPAEAASE